MLVKTAPLVNSRTVLFHKILKEESVTTFYQPIVSLKTGNIVGYEALSRGPQNTEFYSPSELIKAAHDYGKLWESQKKRLSSRLQKELQSMIMSHFRLYWNIIGAKDTKSPSMM